MRPCPATTSPPGPGRPRPGPAARLGHPAARRQQEGRLPPRPRRRLHRRRLRLVGGGGLLGRRARRPPRPPVTRHGLGLCTAAHDRLTAAGVRTPRLLYADAPHTRLAADAAVVEDLPGGSLEAALTRDPAAGRAALERLAARLERLRAHEGPAFGKVAVVAGGGTSSAASCARRVTDAALRHLAEAAARDGRIAAVHGELADLVREPAAAVRPRARHGLVHGELGPDHVLLDAGGHPALIDIEGLMYFDAEWEHVFLRIRFGSHYDVLRAPGLDEDRLRLYRLATHLSLVAGPLRLLDGDFPHPEAMRAIAGHNVGQTLSLLRTAA